MWAAVTEYHTLGGLNNRNILSYNSGGWKSKIRMSSVLVPGEPTLPGSQKATLLLCSHMAFPLYTHRKREISGVSSSSYKDIGPIRLGPHLF